MANSKPKLFSTTTPAGPFRYPALTKPDYGNDEFPKPDGEYKVGLILSLEDAQPLIDKLQPLHDAAIAEGKEEFKKLKVEQRKKLKELTENPFFSEEYDKETEEPTGNVIFTFKAKASGTRKDKSRWSRKVALFDAKGKPLLKVPDIWGGTVGKVSFEVNPYFIPATGTAGISLRLQAVQIIDLRSGTGRDAGAYGFGEEDGFDGSTVNNEEGDDTPFKDESGTDDNPDF